jgi:hypothetical protein
MDQVGVYLGYVRDLLTDFGLLPIIQGAIGAMVVIAIIFGVVRALRQS